MSTSVRFRNVNPPEGMEDHIHERIAKLEKLGTPFNRCDVVVEAAAKSHAKGNAFHVRIHATVPKGDLVVDRDADGDHGNENMHTAVNGAFDALKRQARNRNASHHRTQSKIVALTPIALVS